MHLRKRHRAILRDLLTVPPDDALNTAELLRRTTEAVGDPQSALAASYELIGLGIIETWQEEGANGLSAENQRFALSRAGRMMAVWLPPEPTGWAWFVDWIFGLEAPSF